MSDVTWAKQELRRAMRATRRTVATPERSAQVCDTLIRLVETMRVSAVMLFDPVPGEPDLAEFERWCRARGLSTIAPASSPTAERPAGLDSVDVVVVPGLAFTRQGHRLGQGGGWYDGVLSELTPGCVTVGVAFAEQIVPAVPTEAHDMTMQYVATDVELIESAAGDLDQRDRPGR